jgi:hypothetical protein
VATRTLSLLLICGAGALAAAGGWLLGERLWPEDASAALPQAEVAAEALPVANRDGKADRLATTAAPEPEINQVYETARAWLAAPVTAPRPTARPEKPSRLFLNDAQIAGIHKRLNLTPAQQRYWGPVEAALREVTLQIEDYKARLKRRDDTFDTDSAAIARLKAATRALYAQLTGTQKNDLALLVRMAGLGPAFAELTGTKAAAKGEE